MYFRCCHRLFKIYFNKEMLIKAWFLSVILGLILSIKPKMENTQQFVIQIYIPVKEKTIMKNNMVP